MLLQSPLRRRQAATIVECAIVYPILFLFLLGLVVGSLGIFRYQEVAALAREAARYGSTHGAKCRQDCGLATGDSTVWASDVYTNAICPNIIALDPNNLSYTCT